MSLNDIQLNPQLLAGLYAKSLVGDADAVDEVPAKTSVPGVNKNIPAAKSAVTQKHTTVQQPTFKSLGNNQKNVLIGVHYTDSTHLPDAQLDFLTNLLKACKLGLGDVAIINTNNYSGVDYSQILEHFKTKVVMLFGMTAQEFGFPFEIPEYQVQQFAGRTVIHSPALHGMQDNKTEKGKLWMALKKVFNL